MPVLKPSELVNNRVQAIKDFHAKTGVTRAELDLSGGIDSAVMAGLLVLALGAKNVTLAHLAINTNPVQTARATRLAQALGCRLAISDFTVVYDLIVAKIKEDLSDAGYNEEEIEARIAADPTILGSIRSTLRAPLGRAYNRMTGGGIRHGTGNECEDRFLRFYQKGGDGEVDTNPIAMLSKAEVYQLAYELGNQFAGIVADDPILGRVFDHQGQVAKLAYAETIGAVPSADLWNCGDQHTDESEIKKWLGADFTYGRLDPKTGKVVSVGTIERVARFLDEPSKAGGFDPPDVPPRWQTKVLFGDGEPDWSTLVAMAEASKCFDHDPETIEALLRGTRKAEAQTRHKENPAIPQLGTRAELLELGILSDNFEDYGIG